MKPQWSQQILTWAKELGFSQIGISGIDLKDCEEDFLHWLAQGFHGEMAYLKNHGLKRLRPQELVPGTVSVISAQMNYLPSESSNQWRNIEWSRLAQHEKGVISIYARGRDYHKILRSRLQKLAQRIEQAIAQDTAQKKGAFNYRVFTDSAPVYEVELAKRAGLGWRGKHTLLLNRNSGSTFFLGEIFVNFPLEKSEPYLAHCGSCCACLDICPTQAIIEPYVLDARRCISYLTIEHPGSIPIELRPLMGNRIYGCDDCQLICPWNKFAQKNPLPDFLPRKKLLDQDLATLFQWSEAAFLRYTEGSPIRRIGHARWLRNIAIALGNAKKEGSNVADGALALHIDHPDQVVREHVRWALSIEHWALTVRP